MANPLQIIKDWVMTQDEEMQEDLFAMVYFKHPLYSTQNFGDATKVMLDYLDTTLDERETIQRTALMKGLINFALSGRKTVEGWEITKQRNIDAGKSIAEQNPDRPEIGTGPVERFLNTYEDRKNNWIAWGREWDLKVNNDEFDSKATDYFYSQMLSQMSNRN